jgi:hypothetical protein
MDVVELNLSVEPRLYPKHRKRVNTSFIFFTIFSFAGLVPLRSPASSSRKREKGIHRLAQRKNDD